MMCESFVQYYCLRRLSHTHKFARARVGVSINIFNDVQLNDVFQGLAARQ